MPIEGTDIVYLYLISPADVLIIIAIYYIFNTILVEKLIDYI